MAELGEFRATETVTALVSRSTAASNKTTFTRLELNALLQAYGIGVAAGDWRDYAINFSSDRASFSIYRRSAETPQYIIEKRPLLAQRQGAFSVRDQRGLILRRGHDLARVLLCLRPIKRLK